MEEHLVASLYDAISLPRLERYRHERGSDLDMITNYFWNIALSEALYPGLAGIEVTLRNSIHNALTTREQTDDWFRHLLQPRQLRDYAGTYLALLNRNHHEPKIGQIVAELNFGFWVALLSQPYHQSIWTPNKAAMIHQVFPHLGPTANVRRYIHEHYNALRGLRNRVMHHEPIVFGLRWNSKLHPISDLHDDILTTIGWISPIMRETISYSDRFAHIYSSGREQIKAEINRRHGG